MRVRVLVWISSWLAGQGPVEAQSDGVFYLSRLVVARESRGDFVGASGAFHVTVSRIHIAWVRTGRSLQNSGMCCKNELTPLLIGAGLCAASMGREGLKCRAICFALSFQSRFAPLLESLSELVSHPSIHSHLFERSPFNHIWGEVDFLSHIRSELSFGWTAPIILRELSPCSCANKTHKGDASFTTVVGQFIVSHHVRFRLDVLRAWHVWNLGRLVVVQRVGFTLDVLGTRRFASRGNLGIGVPVKYWLDGSVRCG